MTSLAPELTRRDGSKAAVLARLQRGAATNLELNDVCFRYGARIFELRREGYRIEKRNAGDGCWLYWLVTDAPLATPRVREDTVPVVHVPPPAGRLF